MIRYKCPTCGKITEAEPGQRMPCRPFCCERCQQIDLGKWLSGQYGVSELLDMGQDKPAEAQDTNPEAEE